MSLRKSWADFEGIKSGVFGETIDGIPIDESNRATEWETQREGIEELRSMLHYSYRRKGVKAILFGVHLTPELVKYAIFVKPGFLVPVPPED